MDIHQLFKSDSFPYISGGIKRELKEQIDLIEDIDEYSNALLVVDVQGYEVTEFVVKTFQSAKPVALKASNLKEIEGLVATHKERKGFCIALINTSLGPFKPAMLEALKWDPDIIVIDQGSLRDFPSEDQELITRAAMTGHAVYLVKLK